MKKSLPIKLKIETANKEMQPLTKKSLKFCFSNSLEQIIKSSTRNTDKTETFIDHVLTNSSERASQSNVLSTFIRS